jgi:hypothetical protein
MNYEKQIELLTNRVNVLENINQELIYLIKHKPELTTEQKLIQAIEKSME